MQMFVLSGLKIFNPKSFRIVINSIYYSDNYFFVFIILIIAFLSLAAVTIVTLGGQYSMTDGIVNTHDISQLLIVH